MLQHKLLLNASYIYKVSLTNFEKPGLNDIIPHTLTYINCRVKIDAL